ncbi:hypothetical protein SAY86_018941 [Trapa natans]|uniref:PRA1 family protein n=1 Tax=Trapa natans TaxID=22666 RepID=A0AAN7LB78_TRANT|nr:hypothetical protein SAY86_018941 [Trapa natans]
MQIITFRIPPNFNTEDQSGKASLEILIEFCSYRLSIFSLVAFAGDLLILSGKMTSYGTIPASSQPYDLQYISQAKERIKAGLGTRRPWRKMLDVHSIRLPLDFPDAVSRSRTNIAYFRMNYAIVVLFILFLSLLWHPISLIVLIAMMAAWLFLYFLRDEPLVIFHRTIDDRVVLIVLSILTVVFLFLTNATWNIIGALLIGVAVIIIHSVFRKTDDLAMDEEAAGLMTGVGIHFEASSSSS